MEEFTENEKNIMRLFKNLHGFEHIDVSKDHNGLPDYYHVRIIPEEKQIRFVPAVKKLAFEFSS